jgi:pyruvate formate lyase activating enzyme
MLIKGIQKTSLVDYPPNMVSTIFVGNCNFRCGYCHNPELVLNYASIPTMDEKEIFDFLEQKKKWIDGVCISGGEPTIYHDLADFCAKLKQKGFLVKLDTNGTNPSVIRELIDKKLVDYIAMDIKTSLNKYDEAAGVKVNKEKIKETVKILMQGTVDFEFRTTAVPDFFDESDAKAVGEWLKGAKKFLLQQFRSDVPLVDKSMMGKKPYPIQTLENLKKLLEPYFVKVELIS